MERRWEGTGIADVYRGSWEVQVAVVKEEGVLHVLEFLERGVAIPLVSRRSSMLVPVLTTSGRGFSVGSKALGPLLCSLSRETRGSSASSSAGEPDERLCIGRDRVRRTHPARSTQGGDREGKLVAADGFLAGGGFLTTGGKGNRGNDRNQECALRTGSGVDSRQASRS
jgi:hypothetical protein